MPLKPGNSRETIAYNIRELHKANETKPPDQRRENDQIVAIALSNARKTGSKYPLLQKAKNMSKKRKPAKKGSFEHRKRISEGLKRHHRNGNKK